MYYLSYQDIAQLYSKVVEVSGGGYAGVIDKGRVEGILEQVKNDFYYPEIEDKLTYLFYTFAKYHCFADGNKRIALASTIAFLNYNGYVFILSRFIREMENVSIHVASGAIDKPLLHKIITSIIYEDDFSEELKMEIAFSLQTFYDSEASQ